MSKILFRLLMSVLNLNNKYNNKCMENYYSIIAMRFQIYLTDSILEMHRKENKEINIDIIKSLNELAKEEYKTCQNKLENLTGVKFGYFNEEE